MAKKTISAVIIARNEEKRLKKCLAGVSWCDEQIVIDNASTDKTAEIAKKAGARVYSLEGTDFSRLRNLGLAKAGGDWIVYVDADEIVTKELRDEIQHVIRHHTPGVSPGAYRIARNNIYLGMPWPYSDKPERLFYADHLVSFRGKLHESPEIRGEVSTLANALIHDSHRTLQEMVRKTNEWSEIEAENRFRRAHPPVVWWRIIRVFMTGFFGSYIRQRGYRAGTLGLVESMYQGFSMFVTYAKLWERQTVHRRGV